MVIRKNSRPYKILKYLAASAGILVVSTISPLGGANLVRALVREYFRKRSFEKSKFLRDLRNLQVRNLINWEDLGDGRVRIILTKGGKEKVLTYSVDDIRLNKEGGWDGKWRLVMFDIPHRHKLARDSFRIKLKGLGFYPIQKSVYITPYPCEDEIDFLTSLFNVRKHVLVIYVSHFEGESKLRHYFNI